jgi:hypothetical protein
MGDLLMWRHSAGGKPTAENFSIADDEPAPIELSPSLIDKTPAKYACVAMQSCPAVLRDESTGQYVVIGQRRDPNGPGIRGRVGDGEVALEISAELLEGALSPINNIDADDIFRRMSALNSEAALLFLSCLNALMPAAISPELSAQIRPQTQTAAASSS